MFKGDPDDACQRVEDASRLERRKLAQDARPETAKTITLPPNVREADKREKQAEQAMRKRYSPKQLESLRNHGFTGLSVEKRIARAGQSGLFYTNVYRGFSSMAHGMDELERQVRGGALEPAALVDCRDHVALSTAHRCVRSEVMRR